MISGSDKLTDLWAAERSEKNQSYVGQGCFFSLAGLHCFCLYEKAHILLQKSSNSAVPLDMVLLQGIAEQRQFLRVINAFNAPLSWLRVLKYMEELSPKTRQVAHYPNTPCN